MYIICSLLTNCANVEIARGNEVSSPYIIMLCIMFICYYMLNYISLYLLDNFDHPHLNDPILKFVTVFWHQSDDIFFLLFTLFSTSYYSIYINSVIYVFMKVIVLLSCVILEKSFTFYYGNAFSNLSINQRLIQYSYFNKIINIIKFISLLVFVVFFFGNTNVQWICDFGCTLDANIKILGFRSMSSEDFVEFYSYDCHHIIRINGIAKKGICMKVSQKNKKCVLEVFYYGKKLNKNDSFFGIVDLKVGMGFKRSDVKLGSIPVKSIKLRNDGFLSWHEVINKVKSTLIKDKIR